MRRLATPTIALLLTGFLACGPSEPIELPYPHAGLDHDDDGGTGGAGGAPSTVGPTSTSATTGASGSTTATSSGSGSTSASTGSTSSTGPGPGATTGSGGGGVCTPEPDDPECIACAKVSCCVEVEACVDDASCSCWISCIIETAGAVGECIGQCGAPGGELFDLLDCSSLECEAECPAVGF